MPPEPTLERQLTKSLDTALSVMETMQTIAERLPPHGKSKMRALIEEMGEIADGLARMANAVSDVSLAMEEIGKSIRAERN